MSQNQKMAELRQQLERWKSHNEVHAKPADGILYEFLSALLKMADYDELPAPTEPPALSDEIPLEIGENKGDILEGDGVEENEEDNKLKAKNPQEDIK